MNLNFLISIIISATIEVFSIVIEATLILIYIVFAFSLFYLLYWYFINGVHEPYDRNVAFIFSATGGAIWLLIGHIGNILDEKKKKK